MIDGALREGEGKRGSEDGGAVQGAHRGSPECGPRREGIGHIRRGYAVPQSASCGDQRFAAAQREHRSRDHPHALKQPELDDAPERFGLLAQDEKETGERDGNGPLHQRHRGRRANPHLAGLDRQFSAVRCALEGRDECGGGIEPIGGVGSETLVDRIGQRLGQLRRAQPHGRRPRDGLLGDDGERAAALKGIVPGGGEMERDAERVEVGPSIDRLTARLFGSHVSRGAGHFARRHHAIVEGDAEVGDEGAIGPLLEQDVFWFDVAMHDTALVCIRQRPADFTADATDGVGGEWSRAAQAVGQRFARHIRHDEPREVTRLLDPVNGYDVRVKTLGGNARLAQKSALHIAARGDGRCEQFDRDRTFENHVAREIHDTHSTAADLTLEREAAGEGGL